MLKFILFLLVFCGTVHLNFGQHLGLTFKEAEKQGISIKHLDSVYTSAVHADSALAVFKTEAQQIQLQHAYVQLLQDLGQFLSDQRFTWKKATRCFNRIYFSPDGSIDYFLFNFLGKAEDKPDEVTEKEFQNLLNLFIANYQFPLKATVKFAQCSPTTYLPKK